MINILIGPPGGGKSYEAVVFHILPALASGRKVITNLPLVLERLAAIDPSYPQLVEIRIKTLAEEPKKDWEKAKALYTNFGIAAKTEFFVNRPFAHPEDYGDSWRHPVTGAGPLYVIDECHLALPRGSTKRAVEEWFSLHRHESADVLLITQSYGKVSQSIIDLVQICYRVKKGTAFGFSGRYIRKVQDGVRGDVVNTSQREYKKQYFGLYKSHTRGGGQELEAQDIKPIWKRWPFIGTALCFIILIALLFVVDFKNPFKPGSKGSNVQQHQTRLIVSGVSPTALTPVSHHPVKAPPSVVVPPPPPSDPFEGRGLHLIGEITFGDRPTRTVFAVSQGGQGVTMLTLEQVHQAGYSYTSFGPCAGMLDYKGRKRSVICDAPTVSVQIPLG